MTIRIAAMALAAQLVVAAPACATPHDNLPKILIHLTAPASKSTCAAGALSDCQAAIVRGEIARVGSGPYYFAWLVVARGQLTGLAGLQCGLQYENGMATDIGNHQGIDILGWTLCASFESPAVPGLPEWPRPGSSNMITWDASASCQTGETAVAGYFYMASYTDDRLSVIPRPVDGLARVGDCSGSEHTLNALTDLGSVTFGSEEQIPCNPCGWPCNAEPVTRATWSGIKVLMAR